VVLETGECNMKINKVFSSDREFQYFLSFLTRLGKIKQDLIIDGDQENLKIINDYLDVALDYQ